jgi:hypothetical protein
MALTLCDEDKTIAGYGFNHHFSLQDTVSRFLREAESRRILGKLEQIIVHLTLRPGASLAWLAGCVPVS